MSTNHPIRFGIQTGQQNVSYEELARLWRDADRWGYDSLWAFDHHFPIFTDPAGPCMEAWTTLSALAGVTTNARIGHMVNGNTYRAPALLAKQAATLDHISGGRLNLGIGAGWFEPEHTALGFEFKTVRGRLEALEESCQILKGMFSGEPFSLDGRHYKVENALGNPKPVQEGGVPLLIAGEGRKILLRIVAQYADQWNAIGSTEHMKELIDCIEAHGEKVGRDTSVIEKTVMMALCYTPDEAMQKMVCELLAGVYSTTPEAVRKQTMVGSKDQCLEKIDAYRQAGVTHFIFMSFTPYDTAAMQAFAEEVAPAAR
jgi:F420-dependent oxidoreductase-like protein